MSTLKPTSTPSLSALRVLLVGCAYFCLASISIYLSRSDSTVAHFWYPNAIAIAFLLKEDKSRAWFLASVLVLAIFLANWLGGSSWNLSLAFILPNLLDVSVAIFLAQRFQMVADFDKSPQRMLRFVFLLCLLPSAIGALTGASILAVMGSAPFAALLPVWFVSSSVGTLALLPLLLIVRRDDVSRRLELDIKKRLILYVILVLVVSYGALRYLPFPFIYLIMPLMLIAVETNTKTVAALIFLQSLVIGVTNEVGYFSHPIELTSHWSFLNYLPILVTFIPVLILSASMNLFRDQHRKKREIEDELQRKHTEMRMIVDNVPALIGFWDTQLRNRFANRVYLEFFGQRPEEILGKHFSEVVGAQLYAQNLPHMEAALRGEVQMFERTIVDPQGRARASLTSYVPSYRDGEIEGVYAFITDVTEMRSAQQAQFVAQERLQSVIDSATEFSIITTDLHGTITLFSRGAEKMLGYSGDELLLKTSPAVLHLAQEIEVRSQELSSEFLRPIEGFETFVVKAKLGIYEAREWTYVHKTGRYIPVRLVVTSILDANKNLLGYLGIAHDISAEKELQKLLIDAKDSAEKTSKAKSDFVANMSHEIRTPMNAVLGITQLLASTNLSSEQRKYLEMIKVSGQSLMGILNDILDFSKIEANHLELSNAEFLLDDVLGALASMMAASVGDKDIEVAIGVDVDVPKRYYGDQLRLQQILTNLTSNALKFTKQGEVAVFVDQLPAQADPQGNTQTNPVQLRFRVRDTGIGMDSGQIKKLFQPFSQADASTTRQFGGTGLGLSISKRILDKMGGTIDVDSQLGQGSEFSVIVPMHVVTIDGVGQRLRESRKLRLLVVDDNLTSNDYISRTIRSWNWQVASATSGQQAIEMVRQDLANEQYFDAIIVDWQMPEMDGLAAIKVLRHMLPKAKTPLIIMVSAFSRDRMIQDAASKYADAILMKPITGSDIFDVVHEAIMLCSDQTLASPFVKSDKLRQSQSKLHGAKLLLVEDNPFNQIVAKGFLEQGGASLVVMENGALAVEHLRSHGGDYHMVLMDVQMPIMDGIDATKVIRNELHLSLPIIAMSAGVLYSERDRCIQAGMDDFIAKPIDLEQMFDVIRKYLPRELVLGNEVDAGAQRQSHAPNPVGATETVYNGLASEVFNPRSMEMLVNADPKCLPKILASISAMVERASTQIPQLQVALREQRLDDAARALHTMRGSIGTLGAKYFAELSLQTETAIRDGRLENIEVLLQSVQQAFASTAEAARAWIVQKQAGVGQLDLDELQSTTSQTALGDLASKENAARAAIQEMTRHLQQNNIAACDNFIDLKLQLTTLLSKEQLAQLEQSMNDLDFRRAALILSALAS